VVERGRKERGEEEKGEGTEEGFEGNWLLLTCGENHSNDVNLKILAIPNLAGCGTHTLTDSECVLAYQATLSG